MASLSKDKSRDAWQLQFRDHQKKKRKLWIGKTSKRAAEQIQRHVAELVRAKKANIQPAVETAKWVSTLTGRIRDRLVDYGICDAPRAILNTDAGQFLGPFLGFYISSLTNLQWRTINNYEQAAAWLLKYFGERHLLRDITLEDALRWSRWLDQSLAPATCSQHRKRAKAMFRAAVKDRILTENPFAELRGSSESNPENDFYVDLDLSRAVLDACPDAEWRVIFGLVRFGGLRCPSEVLALNWCDVNWEKDRLLVHSRKTKRHEGKAKRITPLFPALRQLLEELSEVAGLGICTSLKQAVVNRYRGEDSNLRTQLHRIVERAGHKPWPRCFDNLRASAIDDAKEAGYHTHELDAWFGNSEGTRRKHYYQVRDQNYERALKLFPAEAICSSASGSISADPGLSEVITQPKNNENPLVIPPLGGYQIPPSRVELLFPD